MAKNYYNPILGITLTKSELKNFRSKIFLLACVFFIGFGIFMVPVFAPSMGFGQIGKTLHLVMICIGVVVMLLAGILFRRAMKKPKIPYNTHRSEEQKKKLERRAARNKGH